MVRAANIAGAASALVVASMFVHAMGQAPVATPAAGKFTLASGEIKHGARFAAARSG